VGSRLSASVVDFYFAPSRLLIAAAANDKLTRKMGGYPRCLFWCDALKDDPDKYDNK
jgi:hypothetical protein